VAASRDDGPPPGEPPYDPEFDGPPPKSAYDGFAPGDEPTDEIIDSTKARQTSQQQAVDVVKQAFRGAETIGEVDAR
jgi:DNA polymerase-3 subunit gamma/tau